MYFFLFITVFDVMYMLLPWYVICSKIVKKNLVYSQVSRDFARFPVFTVRALIENLLCVVCCLCHIAAHHTIGAKRLNLGFFCGLSHLRF